MTQSKEAKVLSEIGKTEIAPVGVPIDPAREHANWMSEFAVMMSARQICEMDQSQLDTTVGKMIDEGMGPDDILKPVDGGIEFLEGAIEILKAAQARLVVGMARACEAV